MSDLIKDYEAVFPFVITLEDAMRESLRLHAELEILRNQVRQLEAERDQWQRQAMSHG